MFCMQNNIAACKIADMLAEIRPFLSFYQVTAISIGGLVAVGSRSTSPHALSREVLGHRSAMLSSEMSPLDATSAGEEALALSLIHI